MQFADHLFAVANLDVNRYHLDTRRHLTNLAAEHFTGRRCRAASRLSTLLTHHAKLIGSLWKHFSRNSRVSYSGACLVHAVHVPDSSGVHRTVQIVRL